MKTECIDGFSKSAFKSLAVKSLRIGWPAGLDRAQAALGKSEIRPLLVCGVFEDIFPAVSELAEVMAEVRRLDYAALCSRQTHHGRGHTPEFCRLEPEAVAAAQNRKGELWAQARAYGLWLPRRALNCFWTWLAIRPQDAGQRRATDETGWQGIPLAVLDGHTLEGKRAGRVVTVLSGHYDNHATLAERVAREGWRGIRAETHAEIVREAAEVSQGEFRF